jgi:hypothetical protein
MAMVERASVHEPNALDLGLIVLLYLPMIAGLWRTAIRAGRPGWSILVPFYGFVVMLEIGDRPRWWAIPMVVPVLGLVPWFLACAGLARRFDHGVAFGAGLAVLPMVFFPILGFEHRKETVHET